MWHTNRRQGLARSIRGVGLKINNMSNELVKKESPLADMMEMAKLFTESGMFTDIKSMGMAFVKMQAGKEIGIEPFAAMSGIHIIQGKTAIGAGLMAGCVKGSPKYDYIVKSMTDTECSINFTTKDGKLLGNSTFTKADAVKAQTKNMDKFPKNMLFARAMSNGVKWFCPDVFTMPVYTPEEMGDANFTEDIQHEEVKPTIAAEPVKKAISKKAFEDGVKRIAAGETGLIQQIKDTFTLNAEQLAELTPFEAKIIVEPATNVQS